MTKFLEQSVFLFFGVLLLSASCKTQPSDNLQITPWYPEFNKAREPVKAVFESRVPCKDCQRIKLAVALYGKPQDSFPTTYAMSLIYVGKNDDRLTHTGSVILKYGTFLDNTHTVYQLSDAADGFQYFWKMTDSLLFVLDGKFKPKVGDAGQGYVLNRVK